MPKVLSDAQVEYFREEVYLNPFDSVGRSAAATMCSELEAYQQSEGKSVHSITF